MGMRVRQDWHHGELELFTDKPHGQRVKCDIKTGQLLYFSNVMPGPQKLRRLGKIRREIMEEEVSKLLVAGFIRRVDDADWVSPEVIVPKKNGNWRVCVDFRPVNAATKQHHYPMPFQDEILDEVAGHERYSICDGFCGYFQIEIAPEDQKLTSFITPWGVFCYTRMPFGLVNAYAMFQGWMDRLLSPFFRKFARSFMDDIGIYSDRKSHVQKVDQIFAKIDGDGGQLNPNK